MSEPTRKLSQNEVAFRAFDQAVRNVEQRIGDSSEGEFVYECSDPGGVTRLTARQPGSQAL